MMMHKQAASKPGSAGKVGVVTTPPTITNIRANNRSNVKGDLRVDDYMKGFSTMDVSANAETRLTTTHNRKSIDRATNSTIGVTHFD